MEDLIRVLEKTVSASQTDQNEAVKFIQDYIQSDLTGFLKALSDALFDQQNPPVVRAAAGLQLKNQLTAREEALRLQQQERWRSLPDEARQHIKDRVFRALGTEIFRPSSAPQCVAYIAIVELPEGKWPGLIEALTKNVLCHQNTPQLRLASLEAIGHICQDIDQSCLEISDSDSILNAITASMDEDKDIRMVATTALVSFSERKLRRISTLHQTITFAELGKCLKIQPDHAERIVAQMIREGQIQGHLDQIAQVVHFDAKDVLQMFDEGILSLCSEVNCIIEKIRNVVSDEWWTTNAC